MTTLDKIQRKIKNLRDPDREKVLKFVEGLEYESMEINDWNRFSLYGAVKNIGNDNLPEYTEEDLKEKWEP